MKISEISAVELSKKLQRREKNEDSFILLDVRNENESEICSIPGTDFLIPVKSLKSKISEIQNIPKEKEMIVYCKSGVRSVTGAEILIEENFLHVYNLTGGILSYIQKVDPELPTY